MTFQRIPLSDLVGNAESEPSQKEAGSATDDHAALQLP